MKRGASLILLELLIMLLVFSLAAALCVRVFFWADRASRRSADEDMALLQAQNAAELLKAGQWTAGTCIFYDENWQITDGQPVYRLEVQPVQSGNALLGRAGITVTDRHGTVLARLTVCWQEVAA